MEALSLLCAGNPDLSGRCRLWPFQLQNELWFFTRIVIQNSERGVYFLSTAQDVLYSLIRSWSELQLWNTKFRLIFFSWHVFGSNVILSIPHSYRTLQQLRKDLRNQVIHWLRSVTSYITDFLSLLLGRMVIHDVG